MPQNDFLAFATGTGANVVSQAQYASLPAVSQGFAPGLADATQANKVWRQSSFMVAMIGEFIRQVGNLDALDNSNLSQLQTNFIAALRLAGPRIPLLGPTSFYVDGASGNDASPGTSIAPWKTLAKAVTELKSLDMNNNPVSVYCSNAFSTGLSITGPFQGAAAGGPQFIFQAGSSITDTTYNAIYVSEGAAITVSGPVVLTASNTALQGGTGFPEYAGVGAGLYAVSGAVINVAGALNFSGCGTAHITADTGIVRLDASYTISGNAPAHWSAARSGQIIVPLVLTGTNMITVSLTGGSRTFATGFAVAADTSVISVTSSVCQFSAPSASSAPGIILPQTLS